MKKIIFIFFLLVFNMIPIIGSYTKGNYSIRNKNSLIRKTSIVLEILTIYNPTIRQCDLTPLVTANNVKIDTKKLYNQEIRWMALSRDLLKRWNGDFNYGDTITLTSGDKDIDGLWIIQDTLNKRYKNHGDLLFDSRVRKLGKWTNVMISKL